MQNFKNVVFQKNLEFIKKSQINKYDYLKKLKKIIIINLIYKKC